MQKNYDVFGNIYIFQKRHKLFIIIILECTINKLQKGFYQ